MTSAQKVAVITGAGSGIGRAVAIALSANGWSVVLAGRRRNELEKTAAAATGKTLIVETDVADPAAVDRLFAEITATFGRVDLLFNNAGTAAPAVPLDDLTFEQWKRVVDVNLNGVFLCAKAAMRMMKTQSPKGGRIINNGSISATTPRPLSAPYTATKHALTGLTKSIALDGRADNIACSQIDIGNAETELTSKMAAGIVQADGSVKVEPRIDLKHVADAVLYMAGLPPEANVLFMTLKATAMPFEGRG